MDWKYKHFRLKTGFQAPRAEVFEAARSYAADSLGWQVLDTADGLEAKGYSFSHAATARVSIETVFGGTEVAVELLVERASPLGFMLVDVGGYYNRQIQKWFEGIQWALHNKVASQTAPDSLAGKGEPPQPGNRSAAAPPDWKSRNTGFVKVVRAIQIVWIIIAATVFFVLPAIGLVTGSLYIPGRGSGGVTVHGTWARIVSATILATGVFLLWKMRRKSRAIGQ